MSRLTSARAIVVLCVAFTLTACGIWRMPVTPMPALRDPAPCPQRPSTLLVMLPGSYSMPDEFVREGFVRAVRERGIAADIAIVDAHLGYYADGSVLDRLQQDILGPARVAGYRDIWLAGISVGAFGALLQADAQPQGLRGVIAIAPYLGSREVVNEIARAGGLRAWQAPVGPITHDDIDRLLWRHLQRQAASPTSPLYLAYGDSDRFVAAHRLLAAALPPERVFSAPGGHDWPVWTPLWQRVLDAAPLPRDPGCR